MPRRPRIKLADILRHWVVSGLAKWSVQLSVCDARKESRVDRLQHQIDKRVLKIRVILDFEQEN